MKNYIRILSLPIAALLITNTQIATAACDDLVGTWHGKYANHYCTWDAAIHILKTGDSYTFAFNLYRPKPHDKEQGAIPDFMYFFHQGTCKDGHIVMDTETRYDGNVTKDTLTLNSYEPETWLHAKK